MRYILLICILFFASSCAEFEKTMDAGWSHKMQALAGSYNTLIPYMYDESRYSHPQNKYEVRNQLENIVENSSAIPDHFGKSISGADPYYKLGLHQLRQTTNGALKNFDSQDFSYSQQLIQSSLSYCIKCHTRSGGGVDFIQWSNFKLPESLDPLEKSRALIATRQFKAASETLESYINTQSTINDADLIKAIKYHLLVNIRQKSSPETALAMLKRFQKSRHSGKLSENSHKLLDTWQGSLKAWVNSKKANRDLTIEQVLGKKVLFGKNSEGAYVNSLRHSLILHEALPKSSDYFKRAKIYYKLGKIYTEYPELGFWDLPEVYFETCIHLVPHSTTASQCYSSLEAKVAMNSRSSSNMLFQPRGKDYLMKLKKMTTKNPSPSSHKRIFKETQ